MIFFWFFFFFFWLTRHIFLVTRKKSKNSFSTYLTYIHTRILLTLLPNFLKIANSSCIVLFGVTPDVDSFPRHFGAIFDNKKDEQNLSWNVLNWYLFLEKWRVLGAKILKFNFASSELKFWPKTWLKMQNFAKNWRGGHISCALMVKL